MNDILLNPLKAKSISGNIGYSVNRTLVMTEDDDEIFNYVEALEDRNIQSVLGYEKGVKKFIKNISKKNYELSSKTKSEFLIREVFSPEINNQNFRVSTEFISEDVIPIMADYIQTLRQVYGGDQLEDLQALLYARKSWQTSSFKYTFTLFHDELPVSFMAGDYLMNNKLWLFCCGTKKELRGQGLFKELFNRSQNEFQKMGVKEVGLFSARKDTSSIVYKKLGFKRLKKLISAKLKSK